MKWQSRIFLLFIVGLIAAGLAGCEVSSAVRPQVKDPQSEAETPGTNTPELATQTSSSSSMEDACARHDTALKLPHSTYISYPNVIGNFLTQGGTLENLDQGLYEAGMLGQPVGIQAGDFDGNGEVDIAVVLINPASSTVTPEGRLLVYLCQETGYQMHDIQPPDEQDFRTPIIKYNLDLNGDKLPELVAGFGTCSAHTCFEELGIYSWQTDHFANRLSTSTADLPFPDVSVEGPDPNGYYAIKITASGFGSVGAGPQREIMRVYTFDPAQKFWSQFAEKPGSSNYRIHALQDADDLAADDKFQEALILYQQVVSNDSLQDWQDPESERAFLAAYARYKIVAMYTLLGRDEISEAALAELERAVSPGSDLAGYLDLALIFRREGGAADPLRACKAVQEYAAEHYEQLLAPLGPLAFGFANREFTVMDACPWN